MRDFGIVQPGTTLYIPFATYDSNAPSASVTLTGLATTDIEVYKDGSTTQRASDAGYALLDTDGIDFDSVTGIHGISIDLADNTTANFYESGSQYWVVVASVTVDAGTINFIAATFRIGYPNAILNTVIATLASQTSFTLEEGPAEDDALNGRQVVIHDIASAVQVGHAVVSDYTGASKTVTLAAGTTFTAAAGDNVAVLGLAPLQPATAGNTLDTETVESDVAAIHSQTTVIESDTTAIEGWGDPSTPLSDIESSLVIVKSDLVLVYSDTTAIEGWGDPSTPLSDIESSLVIVKSDLVLIYSDTTAIEAAGGGLSVAQDSKLTEVHGDVNTVASDVVLIYSDTTAIHSDTTIIASDVVVLTAAASDIESSLVIVKSDLVVITSDTTAIESELILVHSETTVIQGQTTTIASDVILIYSDTTAIHSQTTVIESDVALLFTAHAEPTGVPAANESPVDKLGRLYMVMRNKKTVNKTTGKKTIFDDAGAAEWEYDLTDDDTTYTETEANAI